MRFAALIRPREIENRQDDEGEDEHSHNSYDKMLEDVVIVAYDGFVGHLFHGIADSVPESMGKFVLHHPV